MQKRAVRIISYNKYIAHTEPIFKKLSLLKLEDISKLKCYYKITKMLLPSYFNCIPLTNINSLHQHYTRAATNIYIHIELITNLPKKTIRFSIIKIVNNTSALIKDKIHTHSLHGVCTCIKIHYTGMFPVGTPAVRH